MKYKHVFNVFPSFSNDFWPTLNFPNPRFFELFSRPLGVRKSGYYCTTKHNDSGSQCHIYMKTLSLSVEVLYHGGTTKNIIASLHSQNVRHIYKCITN